MNTRQQRSALRRNGPIVAASLFTATVIWPRLLGAWGNAIVRPIIVVLILVDFVS